MSWKKALADNAGENTKRLMATPLGRAFVAHLLQEWGLFQSIQPGSDFTVGAQHSAIWLWDRLGTLAPRERMLMLQEWLYQGDTEPKDKHEGDDDE